MAIDEAIHLIQSLPRGSKYIAAVLPEYSWTEEQELATDIQDAVITAALVIRGTCPADRLNKTLTRLVRPAEVIAWNKAQVNTQQRKQTIQDRLENGSWQAVE